MKRLLKIACCFVTVAAALLATVGCSLPDEQVVRVYNWGDYIHPDVEEMFEEETGYEIIYDMFDTNEDMYTKLVNSNTKYDVVFPSDYMVERMIVEGMLAEIDFANVPNYANIDETFRNLSYDPENKYSVPYTWGTLGIMYNTTMVSEPPESWAALWDEQYAQSIFMLNSQRDSIGATLLLLGYDINSTDETALAEAKAKLVEQAPLVLAYLVDEYKDKMIAGEAALALAWQGDAVYCRTYNPDLDYVIPAEGSNIFYDAACILNTAPNKAGAEAFINFLCRPDIAALNAEYIGYSTPVSAARELMGEAGQDRIAYPDLSLYNLEIFTALGDKNRIYDQLWTEITTMVGLGMFE